MGIEHLPILVLLLGVAVFGPKRLPEVGHGLGKAIKEFKKAGEELTDNVEGRSHVHEREASITSPPEAAPRPTAVSPEVTPNPERDSCGGH